MKIIAKALLASSVFALTFAVGVTSPTFVGGDTAMATSSDGAGQGSGEGEGEGDSSGGGGGGGGGHDGHDGHGGGRL
jgi:hypothetical protein